MQLSFSKTRTATSLHAIYFIPRFLTRRLPASTRLFLQRRYRLTNIRSQQIEQIASSIQTPYCSGTISVYLGVCKNISVLEFRKLVRKETRKSLFTRLMCFLLYRSVYQKMDQCTSEDYNRYLRPLRKDTRMTLGSWNSSCSNLARKEHPGDYSDFVFGGYIVWSLRKNGDLVADDERGRNLRLVSSDALV